MKSRWLNLALVILALWTASGFTLTTASSVAGWQTRVDPWVLATSAGGETEFLVYLASQADLRAAAALPTRAARGAYVYEQLTSTAARTQEPLLQFLESQGAGYRSYWIANMIWVRGDAQLVAQIAARPDVSHIYANPAVPLDQLPVADEPLETLAPAEVQWNIAKVNADQVWAAGYTGQGAVIGGQDTGYYWGHPALKEGYRGWNGIFADHNYQWHDAIHEDINGNDVNPCGFDTLAPCDDNSHGTHTMGTMVGDDGGAYQIGMAPGARWIGCRNMEQGVGTPATYIECFQWFMAPTDLNNKYPRPDLAPDVINNSWSCTYNEGCTDPNALLNVVENARAAGILVVSSAGNYGTGGCSTVREPPAIYDASLTVGATDYNDVIAYYSSRGPVTIDGSNRLKPDISAPGSSVLSSVPYSPYYGYKSGTSMAAPHAAGLAALLLSAQPALRGQVDQLESLITQNALPRTTSEACGGVPGSAIPNNTYGWGRLDAAASVGAVTTPSLAIGKAASADFIAPHELLTYTLAVTNTHLSAAATAVVVSDTLPAGASFITATLPHVFDGSTITWTLPTLEAGSAQALSLMVQPTLPEGTLTNDRYLAYSEQAPAVSGSPVSVSIIPYSLDLHKSAAPVVFPGAPLTYTLRLTNTHPTAALTNLVVTDTLPASTTFITATAASLQDDLVTWEIPSLLAGASWEGQLAVRAPLNYTGVITNSLYGARADQLAPLLGAPVTTQIRSLVLVKSASPGVVHPGEILTYTLTVTNMHPTEAVSNLAISDQLPPEVELESVSQLAGAHYAGTRNGGPHQPGAPAAGEIVEWIHNGSLAPGASWQVWCRVRVLAYPGPLLNRLYQVTSEQTPDPILGEPVMTRVDGVVIFPHIFSGYLPP